MNIAFDAKRYFHNKTGLGNYSRMLVKSLVEYFPNENYFLCDTKATEETKIKIIKPSSIIHQLIPSIWRSNGIINDLRKNNIQLYHGLSNEIPFSFPDKKIKSVVTIHDLIFLKYPNQYKAIDRKIYNRKSKFACENADVIIATSNQTKEDIISAYQIPDAKIKVIYQAVEMKKPDKLIADQTILKYQLTESYFLYVGRIEERKNLLGILKALYFLKEKKYKLIVIGKAQNEYAAKCKSYIAENNLQDQVRFINNISVEELSVFYSEAVALVYPSLYEGFGIPIIEAQCCGTAVITTEKGCFSEVAANAALYIDPLNEQTIATAIQQVFNNTELRNSLIEKGNKNILRFTKKIFAEQVMKAYQ